MAKIAIVGGGVAGASVALYLAELGLDITLFEKGSSLVSGPPMCHLHAGGNLYREISDSQCLQLLKESIDLARMYPNAIDYRPTVIAIPVSDSGTPEMLFDRLRLLQESYARLIAQDVRNKVLGESSEYFRLYDREDLEALKAQACVTTPKSSDEWMISVAKGVDLDKVKFPLIMVQEYGINVFRLGATATLRLASLKHCTLRLSHEVIDVTQKDEHFTIHYRQDEGIDEEQFDYLINAAGFNSGHIDDMLGYLRRRFVEFKAAYVAQWEETQGSWPELIFHGERGTPNGMGQFTPYPEGYFQLHGMTKDITLFDDGLVQSSSSSAQPQLDELYLNKINHNWTKQAAHTRTQRAIEHLATYIPAFSKAKVASKPLYGAQQIPGDDETLRAAEVSFEGDRYARCEIVKASSVLSMADAIAKELVKLGYLDTKDVGLRHFTSMEGIKELEIQNLATSLAQQRHYPSALANRLRSQS